MARLAPDTIQLDSPDDIALADRMKAGRERIIAELRKAIIGQEDVVSEVLLTLFVGGNSLIVGVPGLAKTLLVHTLARVLGAIGIAFAVAAGIGLVLVLRTRRAA